MISIWEKTKNGDCFYLYLPRGRSYRRGEVLAICGELILPDLARNTGAFSYRRYCNSQKIFGNIYVQKVTLMEVSHFHFIYRIQEAMEQSFASLFPQNEMGLVLGMMIGDTKDIKEEVMHSFQETGITHLVAVSGSNVMYVLACVQFVFQKIVGRRNTHWVSIPILILFMFISGASSSVVRATIMTTLMLLAEIFYQKSDTISNLSFSAFFLLLWNPLILYDVGFVLSFGGTLGIILLSPHFQKYFQWCGKLAETLAVTCSAQLVLLPIMAYYFHSLSLLAIVTNLIVVPISGLITIFGFVVFLLSLIFFPLALLVAKPLYVLAHFTILVAQFFSRIPFANVRVFPPHLIEMILFYFLLFYACGIISLPFHEKRGRFIASSSPSKRKVIAGIVGVWLVTEVIVAMIPHNGVIVNGIDVGQGDAFFLQTSHHHTILVDGGGSKTYDVGENILMPYLLTKRVGTIDAIFSSHSDADHLNGILTAVQNCHVKKVYIAHNALGYEELYAIAAKRNTKIIEVAQGDCIEMDGVQFEILGPAKGVSPQDVNAYSLIVKMKYQDKSILFTGDANQEAELKLQHVKADILKVGHHGSNTSSALAFLARVQPSIAIISVGRNNKYGHPSREVLQRLGKYAKVYTTAQGGEIQIQIRRNGRITIQQKCN